MDRYFKSKNSLSNPCVDFDSTTLGRHCPRNNKKVIGFTIIELMVTLAVVAIVVGIAGPSFKTMIDNGRRTNAVNGLVGNLMFARGEAAKRNASVSLCKSIDGSSCTTNGNFESGWLVFVDPDANGVVEDIDGDNEKVKGVEILLVHEGLEQGATLRIASAVDYITFKSNGTASGAEQFTYCDGRGTSEAKAINIGITGQHKLSNTAPDGSALTCP